MAFSTKYYYTFKDRYDRAVVVNLQFDGFAGSSTELDGAGLEIEWNAGPNNMYKPIRASVATISVYQSTATQLDEFFDITQTECRVQVTIGGSDYWYGFVLSGNYQRPYGPAPNYVQLTAVDQMGIISQVAYKNAGAIYQGRTTALTILNNCLLKTGLSLNIVDMVNVYEDSMTSTTAYSSLHQTYVDQELFLDHETYAADSCYDVIEKILTPFNAVIFQEDAKWYIIRIPETRDSLNYRIYNTSLVLQSSGSVDNVKELSDNDASDSTFLRFINNTAVIRTTLPQAELTFNKPLMSQLLLDTGFENSSAISDLYTDTNSIGFLFSEDDGTKSLRLEWKNNAYYMEYKTSWHGTTALVGANDQRFLIKGRYRVDLPTSVNPGFVYPPWVVIDNGVNEYTADDEGAWLIDSGWPYFPGSIRVEAGDKQWHDLELRTDEIPSGNWDVKIRFLIYQDVDFCWWDNVTIEFEGGLTDTEDVIEINADNLYGDVDSNVTLYLVDSDVVNSQELDKNALSLTGEARADTWQSNFGSIEQALYKICQDNYKANYISPKRTYQGMLNGQFNYYSSLSDGDLRYFPSNVRYNVVESTWDGEWVNMASLWGEDITGTFEDGEDEEGYGDGGSFSTSANQINIEKTQTTSIAKCKLGSTSVTEGVRYKLEITITDNGTSDIPEFNFAGNNTSSLVLGENTWEVVATSTTSTHLLFTESAIAETCDLTIDVFIYEIIGG